MKNLNPFQTILFATFILLISTFDAYAQNVGINAIGAAPENSALLDLNAPDKGFLITRADTANIVTPAFGLMTLAPIDSCLYMYNGSAWMGMGGGGSSCSCNCSSTSTPPVSSCVSPLIDARDNNTYGTVLIGNQCWMSENLNYTPSAGNSWCYNNNTTNCNTYGRLYDWNTASNTTSSSNNPSGVQGVCPTGWHLPSDAEWRELEMTLGMTPAVSNTTGWRGTNEGDALKSSTNWNGNNSSGFSALPGGIKHANGFFYDVGSIAFWWSATESGINGWRWYLRSNHTDVNRDAVDKNYGYSVRCIKD